MRMWISKALVEENLATRKMGLCENPEGLYVRATITIFILKKTPSYRALFWFRISNKSFSKNLVFSNCIYKGWVRQLHDQNYYTGKNAFRAIIKFIYKWIQINLFVWNILPIVGNHFLLFLLNEGWNALRLLTLGYTLRPF